MSLFYLHSACSSVFFPAIPIQHRLTDSMYWSCSINTTLRDTCHRAFAECAKIWAHLIHASICLSNLDNVSLYFLSTLTSTITFEMIISQLFLAMLFWHIFISTEVEIWGIVFQDFPLELQQGWIENKECYVRYTTWWLGIYVFSAGSFLDNWWFNFSALR